MKEGGNVCLKRNRARFAESIHHSAIKRMYLGHTNNNKIALLLVGSRRRPDWIYNPCHGCLLLRDSKKPWTREEQEEETQGSESNLATLLCHIWLQAVQLQAEGREPARSCGNRQESFSLYLLTQNSDLLPR